GCILFEMVTGRRAFTGESQADVFTAILSREPDWTALPPSTPPRLRELLSRCLQKDTRQRLRDIGDARLETARTLAPAPAEPRSARAFGWKRASAIALALAIAAGIAWLILQRHRAGPAVARMPDKSLVVLPASVASDSPGGQLVGDGLVETLSVRLNEVSGIQVVTPVAAVAASD